MIRPDFVLIESLQITMLRMGEVEEKTGRPVCRLLGSKMDREVGGPGDGGTCGGKKSENGRI